MCMHPIPKSQQRINTEFNGEIEKSITIVRYFSAPLSVI